MSGHVDAVREILGLVRQINISMKRRMMCGAAAMGYSMPQFLVMYQLTQDGSVSMHELVDKTGLPKSTLSRIVDQLVRRGVLKRHRPENNRRTVMLSVTDAYTKKKARLKKSVADKIALGMPGGKAAGINRALKELYDILKFEEEKEV